MWSPASNKGLVFYYKLRSRYFSSHCKMIQHPLMSVMHFSTVGQTLLADVSRVLVRHRWGAAQSPGSAAGCLCSAGSGRTRWESAGLASGRRRCVRPLWRSECDSAAPSRFAWNTCKQMTEIMTSASLQHRSNMWTHLLIQSFLLHCSRNMKLPKHLQLTYSGSYSSPGSSHRAEPMPSVWVFCSKV